MIAGRSPIVYGVGVPDPEQREAELGRLIEESATSSSPLRRTLQRWWLRIAPVPADPQRQIDRQLLALVREQRERSLRSDAELVELRAEVVTLREELGGLRGWLVKVAEELGGIREWLQTTSDRTNDVAGRVESLGADQERDRRAFAREISSLSRRVPDAVPLYGSDTFTLERFDAGPAGEVVGFRGAGSDDGARVYLGFEGLFRGTEELIRERQLAYVPLLSGRGPVLDVGCGRGEMLELLRDGGIDAFGIDIDPAMVEHCRAKGFDRAELAEAAAYLEETPSGSLGAVFAGQVIEHLPYSALLRFLRAARASLAPGGILIMETVNPHAPQALKHFWIDTTHQHPLFPEVVIALCRLNGFAGAFVWYPQGSGDPDRDRLEQMDFTVVAEAPAATG